MNIVTIDGMRLLITGGSDGAALAMKPQTGEPVWNLVVAKRGMNTGLVANGKYAIVSHGDENLEGNEMGMLAAFDATRKGKLGMDSIKWMVKGFMGGFSSPVIVGDRLYQIDNGANLHAFDVRDRPGVVEAEPRRDPEGLGRIRRRQDLRRHRERQVLYPAAARRPLRGVERASNCR